MTTNLIMHMIRVKVLYEHGLILCFMSSSVIVEKGEVFVMDGFHPLGWTSTRIHIQQIFLLLVKETNKFTNVKNKCSLGFLIVK
jgi:hypothetical protein